LGAFADDSNFDDAMADAVPFVQSILDLSSLDEYTLRHLVDVAGHVDVTFKDVSFSVDVKGKDGDSVSNSILEPISGHIPAGSMVAIMGPSGCGKSTLLDCLSLRKTASYEGEVLFNGSPADKFLARLVSYVPQGDYGSGLDTVDEALAFVQALSGRIYFPGIETEEEYRALHEVHRVFIMRMLGLEGVRYSSIGDELRRGISGGQRRRLGLAKGLLRIMGGVAFLDEPTSGLSSTDSELVMQGLRNFSRLTKTSCLVVIHQPKEAIFDMFDHLILLTDGRCAYNGPVDEVKVYLSNIGVPVPVYSNPADFIMDCVTSTMPGNKADYMVEKYAALKAAGVTATAQAVKPGIPLHELAEKLYKTPANKPVRTKASAWVQYSVLQGRFFRHMKRDLDQVFTIIFNNTMLGLIVGFLYYDVGGDEGRARELTVLPLCYSLVLQSAFLAFFSVPNLVANRVIYLNEREQGLYNSPAYICAYMITNLVSGVIGILLLVTIAFFLAGLDGPDYPIVFLSVFLSYLSVEAILGVIGVTASSLPQANSMIAAIVGVLALFNGFTANTETSPAGISWICYISPFYYGVQAIAVQLFPESSTDTYGLNREWGQWGSFVVLIGITVVFRIIQAVLMSRLRLGN
jgi:ATP-binding cassette subfamily G (WHITE) protein 2